MRIGSTQPRVVCYWNTSEVKVGKLKIHMDNIKGEGGGGGGRWAWLEWGGGVGRKCRQL